MRQITKAERREVQELEKRMQKLADQWRERIKDPATKAGLEAGVLVLSPLVKDLLRTFPPIDRS